MKRTRLRDMNPRDITRSRSCCAGQGNDVSFPISQMIQPQLARWRVDKTLGERLGTGRNWLKRSSHDVTRISHLEAPLQRPALVLDFLLINLRDRATQGGALMWGFFDGVVLRFEAPRCSDTILHGASTATSTSLVESPPFLYRARCNYPFILGRETGLSDKVNMQTRSDGMAPRDGISNTEHLLQRAIPARSA